MRKIIIQGTIAAFEQGWYVREDPELKVDLRALQEKQKNVKHNVQNYFYDDTTDIKIDKDTPTFRTQGKQKTYTYIVNGDSIDVALRLKKEGKNPVVLNMANAKHPGGGYLNGASAQEETLFRRTNYYQFLDPHHNQKSEFYPFKEFGGIYSSNVLVFRKGETEGYPFMDYPVPLSFVAVAAYSNPKLDPSRPDRLDDSATFNTRKKMRSIFKIALNHKHDCIVLGAFGCGAFRNPPRHIAELFKMVLQDFDGLFKEVHFAILEDHNSHQKHNPQGNLQPFKDVFGR